MKILRIHAIILIMAAFRGLIYASKQETLNQRSFKVGPASQTMGKPYIIIGSTFRVWWDTGTLSIAVPAYTRRGANVGLMLGQLLRRWDNINPTLGQCLAFSDRLTHYGHGL